MPSHFPICHPIHQPQPSITASPTVYILKALWHVREIEGETADVESRSDLAQYSVGDSIQQARSTEVAKAPTNIRRRWTL